MPDFLELEKLLSKITNRYKLAIIAAKRSKLLNLGAEKKVDVKLKKSTTIALYESVLGKVEYEEEKK